MTGQVAALVIENTFTSLEDIVPLKIGILRPFIGKDRCAWGLWAPPLAAGRAVP